VGAEKNSGEIEKEAALLARAKAGDQAAWAALLEPIRDNLLPMVRRMVKSEHEAEDLVQQTLSTMFVQMSRFRGEARLHTWAWRVAQNSALKWLRREANRRRLLEKNTDLAAGDWSPGMTATSLSPETLAADRESLESLHEAFEKLESDERSAITLGLEVDEPPRTPKERVALFRARRKLLLMWEGKVAEDVRSRRAHRRGRGPGKVDARPAPGGWRRRASPRRAGRRGRGRAGAHGR
jgi:RNA polymerase sigma-70 factor (ECF subfamily)